MRRRTGLTALFWRYLLVTGGAVVLLAVLWWGGLSALLRSGFVLPAGTAAGQADGLVRALEAGELTPAELPHYYRWATFDGSAQVVGQRGMDGRRLGYARAALEGDRTLHGFPYQQYHRSAQLPDGTVCLLQFDYSMPYGSPALQGRLPEFQTCATAVLLAGWLAAGALSTRHFAGLLRRDAALLTAATGAIAARRLDVPLDGGARVRELGESLAAMEQLRQALARSLSEQWAMEQERTQALAALAHDLKTPLTSVIGYLTLLWDEPQISQELRAKYTGIALHKAQRLEDLINEFFDITRFSLSHLALAKQEVNLTRMLEQMTYEFQPALAEKRLTWTLQLAPNVHVFCDPDKLERVFDNLFRNAVHYSYGQTAITLHLEQQGEQASVRVENRGKTIPPEKLSQIFEQFFRLDSARGTTTGGAGLGLAIAKEIVELHGGTIAAESQDEHIAFTVRLPRALQKNV